MKSATPAEVHALEKPFLLDVREPDELAQARIDGALHIPIGTVIERIAEIPNDQTVYVLCHVGGRSAQVVQYLEQQGYDVVNVEGGILAWYQAGLPVSMGADE